MEKLQTLLSFFTFKSNGAMFVAINYITCLDEYREKFESLMRTRAGAIDTMPGFQRMEVLKPVDHMHDYLIISHWDSEEYFNEWTRSSQFKEGHRRGFSDMVKAKEEGRKMPMKSSFKTYQILTRWKTDGKPGLSE
jgi:heme-degrading monooxygenase HmoA